MNKPRPSSTKTVTRTMLLVDDEELARCALRKMVSKLFSDIRIIGEAENGRTALELSRSLNPNIILMDIKIPGMNGLEVSRKLLQERPDVCIIVISAYDNFNYIQEAIRIGIKGYLLKPVRESDLISELSKIQPLMGSPRLRRSEGSFRPDAKECIRRGGNRQSSPLFPADALPSSSRGDPKDSYPAETEREFLSLLTKGEPEKLYASIDAVSSKFVTASTDLHRVLRYINEFVIILKRELASLRIKSCVLFEQEVPATADTAESLHMWLRDFLHEFVADYEEKRLSSLSVLAREYIETHPLREVSLVRISEYLNISPQYFSRLFKLTYGRNFIEYITEQRIEAAKKLLEQEHLNVADTAAQVGYSDAHYFAKLFKRYTGLTPKTYARMHGKGS